MITLCMQLCKTGFWNIHSHMQMNVKHYHHCDLSAFIGNPESLFSRRHFNVISWMTACNNEINIMLDRSAFSCHLWSSSLTSFFPPQFVIGVFSDFYQVLIFAANRLASVPPFCYFYSNIINDAGCIIICFFFSRNSVQDFVRGWRIFEI